MFGTLLMLMDAPNEDVRRLAWCLLLGEDCWDQLADALEDSGLPVRTY